MKMTPMIDVIFLLLIFFVCTASFHAAEEILPTNLSLPGSISGDVPIDPELLDLEEIVVKVLWREGRAQWEINGRNYRKLTIAEDVEKVGNVENILRAAKEVKADLPVILDVEDEVPMENVIDAYDLCRRVGLEKIQFAASVEP